MSSKEGGPRGAARSVSPSTNSAQMSWRRATSVRMLRRLLQVRWTLWVWFWRLRIRELPTSVVNLKEPIRSARASKVSSSRLVRGMLRWGRDWSYTVSVVSMDRRWFDIAEALLFSEGPACESPGRRDIGTFSPTCAATEGSEHVGSIT